ncbi:hypothetical protein GHA01_20320 [Novacetimonas hansenii]|uniref:Uncharacterized protein n=1 Tax=Novacetimonas hansenii TaxID=436 RepID=A0ABQ0SFW8_NOVHA|nr:hypothetical protein Gaha_0105_013 [Novacetimonas hansenii JCM 7643]GEC64183.1 hypothetical protein GHA01_20320 [Novacetimonas hansenii]
MGLQLLGELPGEVFHILRLQRTGGRDQNGSGKIRRDLVNDLEDAPQIILFFTGEKFTYHRIPGNRFCP